MFYLKPQPGTRRIKWNSSSEEDCSAARQTIMAHLQMGWALMYPTSWDRSTVRLRQPYLETDEVYLSDTLLDVVRCKELSSIMDMLRGMGLSPCIYTRGPKLFRFHVTAAGNWWHDHSVADEACAKAVELWIKSKRNPDLARLSEALAARNEQAVEEAIENKKRDQEAYRPDKVAETCGTCGGSGRKRASRNK